MTIKTLLRACAVATAALVAVARPAHAQQQSAGNFGWGVSYMTFAPFVEADSAVIADDLTLDPGLVFTAHAEHWFGWAKFVGVQLGFLTTTRPLETPAGTPNARVTTLTVRGMGRLVGGRAPVMPFVSAGVGATWYDFGEGPSAAYPGTTVIHDSDQDRQLTGVAGGGIDIFPGGAWLWEELGIRLEAADYVTFGRPFDTVEGLSDDLAHNFRFGISLQASPEW